jgi:hypothetical protein
MLGRSLRFGVDEPLQILVCFYSIAGLYASLSPHAATVLFGVAEKLNDQVQMTMSEKAALSRTEFITMVTKALGEEAFVQALAEGEGMGAKEAIAYALQLIEQQAEPASLANRRLWSTT